MTLYVYQAKNYIIKIKNVSSTEDLELIAEISGETENECEEIAEIHFGENENILCSYDKNSKVIKSLDFKEIKEF